MAEERETSNTAIVAIIVLVLFALGLLYFFMQNTDRTGVDTTTTRDRTVIERNAGTSPGTTTNGTTTTPNRR